ncbi:hypothetical protein D3C72_2153060 [compost metagenome]
MPSSGYCCAKLDMKISPMARSPLLSAGMTSVIGISLALVTTLICNAPLLASPACLANCCRFWVWNKVSV